MRFFTHILIKYFLEDKNIRSVQKFLPMRIDTHALVFYKQKRLWF